MWLLPSIAVHTYKRYLKKQYSVAQATVGRVDWSAVSTMEIYKKAAAQALLLLPNLEKQRVEPDLAPTQVSAATSKTWPPMLKKRYPT